MKKAGLKGIAEIFSVDFNDVLDTHKYLMKGTWFKIMFGLIKKIFIGLVTDIASASNYAKCVLSINEKCMTRPTLINLHLKEYGQEFHYYPFAVKLDRCVGSCNPLNDYLIKHVFQIKQ